MTERSDIDVALGRIVALELLVTGLLHQSLDDSGATREHVDEIFSTMRASLQHVPRAVDGQSDQIWEIAAEELERIFANVRARVAG